jgi:dolichol-phosphate mannosyltransferase
MPKREKHVRTVVVTPTYNERENIEPLIRGILSHGPDYGVLIVDDGSPDGTADAVAAIAEHEPRVHLLRRSAKDGLGRAYAAGFHAALQLPVEYIVQMDADLSHDPAFVPMLVHIAEQTESDLVLGSRYISGARIENWPRRRELLSRLGNVYARLVLGWAISDYTTGFTAFRADALRALPYEEFGATGFAFQLEFKHAFQSRRMRIAEVPITFTERERGASKMHTGIIFEALALVWEIRRRGRALQLPEGEPVLRPGLLGGGDTLDER